jgi:hypothetical protein
VAVLHRLAESKASFAVSAAFVNAVREDLQRGRGPIFGEAWRGEIKRWQRAAARCGSWAALLDQECS